MGGLIILYSFTFIKEFQYFTQSYNLTFHNVYMILTNDLLPKECKGVWDQARAHTDETHKTNATHLARA